MKYSHIDKKLKEGYKLHSFRSGGGLRVVRLEKKYFDKIFYGESSILSEALRILNDDIKAGGREYKDVYGVIEDHYLTGKNSSKSNLDNWVCSGKPFDVFFENDLIVSDMSTKEDTHTPKSILEKVYTGETIYWEVPGIDRIFKSYPYRFANNSIGCSTATIPSRSGAESLEERINVKRISTAKTFKEILKKSEELVNIKFEFNWKELSIEEAEEKIKILEMIPKYNV